MQFRHLIASALSAAALAVSVQGAVAADLAGKIGRAPAAAPIPMFNWTGGYVGIHGGWGTGTTESADLAGASLDVDGWFGGAQVGFNWQAPGSALVLGLEGDAAFANIDGSLTGVDGDLTATLSSETKFLATVRGRLGYAIDRVLPYVTGGVAIANNEVTVSASVPGFSAAASDDQTHIGWTVGAGVEWAFAPQWSAKVEYLYMNFGNETYFENVAGGIKGDLELHTVKVGLNYRFN